jgi:hypothetical protein
LLCTANALTQILQIIRLQHVARLWPKQAKRFNPSIETAPVAVLWTDDRCDWEGVLSNLKLAIPKLFSLGEHTPQERTGPGAWLRMVADVEPGP